MPPDRKALFFLAAVLLLGGATKIVRGRSHVVLPADSAALDRQLVAVDSARAASRARKSEKMKGRGPRAPTPPASIGPVALGGQPSDPANPLDLDVASLRQIEALPGIGPVLAGRIIADRESRGPFGSMDALSSVPGIGPVLRARLESLVTFSASPRPPSATQDGALPRTTRRARADPRSRSTPSRDGGPERAPLRVRGLGAPTSVPSELRVPEPTPPGLTVNPLSSPTQLPQWPHPSPPVSASEISSSARG